MGRNLRAALLDQERSPTVSLLVSQEFSSHLWWTDAGFTYFTISARACTRECFSGPPKPGLRNWPSSTTQHTGPNSFRLKLHPSLRGEKGPGTQCAEQKGKGPLSERPKRQWLLLAEGQNTIDWLKVSGAGAHGPILLSRPTVWVRTERGGSGVELS